MVNGVISGVIGAWFLSWFGFEHTTITAFKELFNITLSVSSYYFLFAGLGLIGSVINGQKTIQVTTKDTDESKKIKETKYYN